MKLLKSIEKQLKNLMGKNALMLIAGAVVVYMICQYSSNKGLSLDGMTDKEEETQQAVQAPQVQGTPSIAHNSAFASAEGMSTSQQNMPSGCGQKQVLSPPELLPVQSGGNAFNDLNPNGSGDLQGVNLLKAGQNIGMVGQVNKNANLQIRSEPANPQMKVGPWMNSTIESDTMRRPLEIGSGAQ